MRGSARIGAAWVAAILCVTFWTTPNVAADKADAIEARGKAYAHLMRSTVAGRRGDLKRAAEEILDATKLQPESAAIHAQAAEMMFQLSRPEQAEALARRAIEIDGDHPRALRFLADRATDRARRASSDDEEINREALNLLVRLRDLGHGDAEVLYAIRAIRLRLGDDAGALRAAEELVEMRPGDKQAVGQLIGLLLEQGRDQDAFVAVLAYVSKHPNDAELISYAQELAARLDAWAMVDKAFAEEPGLAHSNTVAQRLWGVAALELGETAQAVESFERALAAQPEDPALRFEVARVFRGVGRFADAAALLHDLAAETPADRRVLLMLGETLAGQGIVDGAQNAFVSALRLFSADGGTESAPIRDAIRRRMVLLYLANDQAQAGNSLLAELEIQDDTESLELIARVALASKDWPQLSQTIETLRGREELGLAALLEGEWMLASGRPARAASRFSEAIGVLGPALRVQIAESYLDSGAAEEGERLLHGWADADDQNPSAYYYLGSYRFRAFGLERAEADLRRVLELAPDHAPAMNFLGYSLAEAGGNLEEALTLVQQALALDPWNGAYLDSLGWIYFQLGRYAEALGPLEHAARELPTDAVILEHLGDLYQKVGEAELAISAWGQALDNGPENRAEIEAKIARLTPQDEAEHERR